MIRAMTRNAESGFESRLNDALMTARSITVKHHRHPILRSVSEFPTTLRYH
jgi:hypothetical protein